MKLCNALVHSIYGRSQRNFQHVTTVTQSWIVQNFVVISWSHFIVQHSKFCSNFEFEQSTVSGMPTWAACETYTLFGQSYATCQNTSSICVINIMMTWHGNTFHITGTLVGNSQATGGFTHRVTVMRSFNVSFVVNLNNMLNKPFIC